MRESPYRQDARGFWWLPLDLLARHGLDRAQLVSDKGLDKFRAVLNDILNEENGVTSLNKDISENISINKQDVNNLVAMDRLILKKIKYTKFSSYDQWRMELSRTRVSDVFHGWKSVRHFNRRR